MNLIANSLNLIQGQRIPHGIASGTLDQHHFGIRSNLPLNTIHIHLALNHVQLIVENTKFFQGALAGIGIANNRLHGIIRSSCQGNQLVPWAENAKKHCSQGMGTGNEICSHQSPLCPKNLGKKLLDFAAANIIIGIAGGGIEMSLRHLALPHGIQHLQGICLGYSINMVKKRSRLSHGFLL